MCNKYEPLHFLALYYPKFMWRVLEVITFSYCVNFFSYKRSVFLLKTMPWCWNRSSSRRFIGSPVELGRTGVKKSLGIPKLTPYETHLVDVALHEMHMKMTMVMNWYKKSRSSMDRLDTMEVNFFKRRGNYPSVDDCAYANFWLFEIMFCEIWFWFCKLLAFIVCIFC